MMHLPALQQADVQLFLSNNLNINWQTWVKPRGVTMCSMMALSGGGGGGGGFSRVAGNPGGGGGGGPSGSYARLVMPAYFLPDELYLQVGAGGLGSTGAGAGGTASWICYGRSQVIPNVVLFSGANTTGGGAGGAGGAGAGGGAPGAPSIVAPATLGQWFGTAGAAGTNGGTHTGAIGVANTAIWNTIPVSGGAGGAGCTITDFAGGAITLQGTPDFAAQSLAGGTAAGANVSGNAGIQLWQPFYMTGGSGGGSNNSGQAGNGGKGGIGCGGGGGGAGTTGGRGGDGGNGMVLIVSW